MTRQYHFQSKKLNPHSGKTHKSAKKYRKIYVFNIKNCETSKDSVVIAPEKTKSEQTINRL